MTFNGNGNQYSVSMIKKSFTFEKQQCLYHNKVSLLFKACNCKMDYQLSSQNQLIEKEFFVPLTLLLVTLSSPFRSHHRVLA